MTTKRNPGSSAASSITAVDFTRRLAVRGRGYFSTIAAGRGAVLSPSLAFNVPATTCLSLLAVRSFCALVLRTAPSFIGAGSLRLRIDILFCFRTALRRPTSSSSMLFVLAGGSTRGVAGSGKGAVRRIFSPHCGQKLALARTDAPHVVHRRDISGLDIKIKDEVGRMKDESVVS